AAVTEFPLRIEIALLGPRQRCPFLHGRDRRGCVPLGLCGGVDRNGERLVAASPDTSELLACAGYDKSFGRGWRACDRSRRADGKGPQCHFVEAFHLHEELGFERV